jgi:2-polyprenyl-3-methyl-5-hydroxy-6-metoxy-1,4-benzoquinol methylase
MTAAYDAIADWYHGWVGDAGAAGNGALDAFLELAGTLDGQAVLDVGCGQGRLTRLLAQCGAQVSGIDVSPVMLAFAEAAEAQDPLGIVYRYDDAQHLSSLADQSFDGVTSFFALMDIPDLGAVLGSIRRVLRPQGWLVFAITHPCFEAPHAIWQPGPKDAPVRVIAGYFDEGFWRSANPAGVRGQVGAYHRTLATYLNAVIGAGFTIERVEEPQFTGAAIEQVSGYAVVPTVLLVRALAREDNPF